MPISPDYIALGLILAAALFFFWTQKLRTDITSLLVMLALIIPWPHPDGKWRGILTYQEGFSGFGSVAVIMVTVEASWAPHSTYAGHTLEEVDFNRDYGFTVLGISRHGQTIQERPMATPLQFGDSLLLLGHISKLPHLEHNPNLMLLGHQHFPMINRRHALITVLLLAGVIFTAITGVLNPAISIPLAAVAVVLFGCVRLADAYNAVDWQAVVTAAGMIPFGLALEKTGAAAEVAQWAGTTFQGWGPPAMLAVVLLLGMVLTHFVDNSAAAIMVAPVAYRVALELGVDPKPFLVGLAICISASFCTPFAHESTILVMGPGRYQFKHYLQIGSAMAFLTWLLATLVTPLVWKF